MVSGIVRPILLNPRIDRVTLRLRMHLPDEDEVDDIPSEIIPTTAWFVDVDVDEALVELAVLNTAST